MTEISAPLVFVTGGADFYADNVADLHREGMTSLQTFLEVCREQSWGSTA